MTVVERALARGHVSRNFPSNADVCVIVQESAAISVPAFEVAFLLQGEAVRGFPEHSKARI